MYNNVCPANNPSLRAYKCQLSVDFFRFPPQKIFLRPFQESRVRRTIRGSTWIVHHRCNCDRGDEVDGASKFTKLRYHLNDFPFGSGNDSHREEYSKASAI